MLKQRAKHRKKPGRKTIAQLVANMATTGHVEDEIALRLGIDKNTLRAKYIDAIKRGKRMARASEAKAGDMTRAEMRAADAILSAINSEWHTPDGNDLWPGLDGDGAQSAPDAFARWLLDGGRFTCSGLSTDFSPERVREFSEVKAAAQELLKQRR